MNPKVKDCLGIAMILWGMGLLFYATTSTSLLSGLGWAAATLASTGLTLLGIAIVGDLTPTTKGVVLSIVALWGSVCTIAAFTRDDYFSAVMGLSLCIYIGWAARSQWMKGRSPGRIKDGSR